MGYTNSPLVSYTKLSPNHSGKRTHGIDRITVHCVVGMCSVETLGNVFAPTSREASSNYGIGVDGRVGMYVEEKNRSWCSSSNANDQRAVTIECASATSHPYAFPDVVYQKLITLCVDICKRNGKKKLLWHGSKEKALAYEPKSDEMVLTAHRWFAATACPGDWMYAREGDLAKKVTEQLGGSAATDPATEKKNTKFPAVPFLVTVIIDDLNIRTKGSMSGKVVGQTGKGVFTITKVKDGWGKLKSGAGWIYLENASYCTIGKTVSSGKADSSEKKVSPQEGKTENQVTGMQASSLKNLSEADTVKKMGPLFTADQKKSGILASVTAAQFILESGYGKTELAQKANNCFGMKANLSGNTWSGSTWDGKSVYTKKTQEDDGKGNLYTITADFRKYPCVEDSIADHSAYLLGAKNGSKLRYAGLKGETDYRKAIRIIKDGGYATDTKYVDKICSIIERWNLTQFDVKKSDKTDSKKTNNTETKKEEKAVALYADRTIHDITAANLSQVPASRGSNSIQFIVVHYLGVPNADNPYLYGGGYGGHYNIKRDGSVYKAADPKTAVVWHCGGGLQGSGGHTFHGICGNYNSIGIECGVCYTDTSVKSPSGDSDQWYFTTETQESLVWLVAKLMKEYGIGIDHVIRHYDVTGKICPNPYVKNNKTRTSWTWDEFKTKLKAQVDGTYDAGPASGGTQQTTTYYRVRKSWADKASQIGAFTVLQNAVNCVEANPGYVAFDDSGMQVYPKAAFKPYMVRVAIPDLNIRKGPSTFYGSHGYTGVGTFTIVDEENGWGLLKSYANQRNGWIKLSYTSRV